MVLISSSTAGAFLTAGFFQPRRMPRITSDTSMASCRDGNFPPTGINRIAAIRRDGVEGAIPDFRLGGEE
jgi:hypothetical protein